MPQSTSLGTHAAAQQERLSWHSFYGLYLESDFPLGATGLIDRPERVDVEVRLATDGLPEPDGPVIAWMPCPQHGFDVTVRRGSGGTWIWHRAVATFFIASHARSVLVSPDSGVEGAVLSTHFVDAVVPYLLNRHGYPVLHAGAVVLNGGAIAFVAPTGQGKSSLVAALLHRQAALLTDDALPLKLTHGSVFGIPGPRRIKVWPDSAEHVLSLHAETLSRVPGSVKCVIEGDGYFQQPQDAAPVSAIYVLQRLPARSVEEAVQLVDLSRREAFATLLEHSVVRAQLLPEEEGRHLPVYARLLSTIPVRLLRYASGYAYLNDVCAAIEAEARGI
ncbi:MAG: hypothetical protein M1296_06450 [Chloroflexi bacterium]|nr:hypothetical protein [Chloroflexota bacterium]